MRSVFVSARIVARVVVATGFSVVGVTSGCECAAPPDGEGEGESGSGAPRISLFDDDDNVAVCGGGAPGFDEFASRGCVVTVDVGVEQRFVVENRGDAPLHITDLRFEGSPAFELVDAADTLDVAVGARAEIVVAFHGGDGQSTVLHISSDAENEPVVDVTLRGACQPDIEIVPAACDFGDVDVDGDPGVCDLSVENVGGCDLVVTDVNFAVATDAAFNADGALALPFVVAPGGAAALRLSGTARETSTSTGTLVVRSLDPDEPEVDVSLRLTGVRP